MNALKYAEWASHYDPENKEMQLLRAHGISFEHKDILEIGSGTGRFSGKILPHCNKLVCIDPDENAMSVLNSTLSDSRLEAHTTTLEKMILNKDSFDYVVFPWSLYLINNQSEVLRIAKSCLKPHGKIVVLQALSGEYETEAANLYARYKPLSAYSDACSLLPPLIESIFGNVSTDRLFTFFEFDSIEQVVECSLFFVEDEEGETPSNERTDSFMRRLHDYVEQNGKVILSDEVLLIIAEKRCEQCLTEN